jgi:cytochrome P450
MIFRTKDRNAQGAVPQRPPPLPKPIEVRRISVWDTLRVQWHVSIPTFFLGVVAANRWFLWWRSRSGAGWQTMRFLRGLPVKYGSDHLWSWFPVWAWFPLRRTLFVFAPKTIDAVLASDENAADPSLKKRAVSRFIPDALVISSDEGWLDRRPFNEHVLDFGKPHRYRDAFRDIVFNEAQRLPRQGSAELAWSDFQGLGTRISHQVILGAGELRPDMAEDLARLLRRSNYLWRDESAFARFHRQMVRDLESAAPNHPGAPTHCLMADSAAELASGNASDITRVPSQIGFWFFVLKDGLELHVARTLALIAAHPDAQEQVRDELAHAGVLNAAAINRLDYLQACLHEQARLWTPVPLLLRRARHSFSLNGEIPIAREQQILIHAGFYHRDSRFFGARADRFSPDDALGDDFPAIYFFSAERQSCVGRSLVTFLLKAALASLLSRFRFELIGPTIEPGHIPYLYDHFNVRLQAI